jgi:hypothetical protein
MGNFNFGDREIKKRFQFVIILRYQCSKFRDYPILLGSMAQVRITLPIGLKPFPFSYQGYELCARDKIVVSHVE